MDRRQFVRLGLHTVLAAGLGAGLTACGEGNSRGGEAGRPRLRLGYLPITDHLLLLAHDYYPFSRVALSPVKFSSWPEAAEALRVGAVDAAFLLTPLGMALRRQRTPIQAVLLGHRNGSVLTLAAREEITATAALAGKRIAIPSRFSTHYLLLRRLLADAGLPGESVHYIDMAPPEMVQALAGGRLDGFIVAEPFGAQAEIQGVGRVFTLSKEIWPGHICCVLNVREEFIQSHPEAVAELVTGLRVTGREIEADRRRAAVRSVNYLGQAPAVIEHVLTRPPDRVTYHDLFPEPADFAATREQMLRVGLREVRDIELDAYLEPAFARLPLT
ncbi:ABC transporter substrate-binding protein [Desulfurivibrio sp. D14AmB]|uniref:ABC transporter substrate-binding protein n=1 Tax=Desulfurivibrio sp. D14AmB TaxID=3374370 RepID=UPI00376F392F